MMLCELRGKDFIQAQEPFIQSCEDGEDGKGLLKASKYHEDLRHIIDEPL